MSKTHSQIVEEVDDLLKIEDEIVLKEKLVKIIEENDKLKSRIIELESSLDDGQTYVIETDISPESPSTEIENSNRNGNTSDHDNNTIDGLNIFENPKEENKKSAGNSSCWNCGGSCASFRDCPEPKNHARINAKREEFMKSKKTSSSRYFLGAEMDGSGNIQPGLPSEKLRKALGLREFQIPSYIYRMREPNIGDPEHNYPLAWLKEAEVEHSNFSLFLAPGSEVPDVGDEDGEIADAQEKLRYDTEKLYEWPGFNAPLDSNFEDQTKDYRAPEMNPAHSKDKMLSGMKGKETQSYVRGEMQDTTTASEKESSPIPTSNNSTPLPSTIPRVVREEEGTPIPQMYSEYKSLPSLDKWAVGMVDHMNYENLPEATGHYDRVREILKKGKK